MSRTFSGHKDRLEHVIAGDIPVVEVYPKPLTPQNTEYGPKIHMKGKDCKRSKGNWISTKKVLSGSQLQAFSPQIYASLEGLRSP
jgi:hypothetical protein